jgi:hypothetical protein
MRRNRLQKVAAFAALLSLIFMVGNGRAFAEGLGRISDQPAATLLLPYFEVNLTNPSGATTLFSIVNASPEAQLAHVVIWSDLSVHVLDFDVYLTGYGLYRLNLNTLLISGTSPQTGYGVSPNGPLSTPNPSFPGCSTDLPLPPLSPTQLTAVQQALIGNASSELGNMCAGINHGDQIMRGYITIDDVNECSFLFPGQPGYLSATESQPRTITDNNVLWGDSFYINKSTNQAFAQPLVHVTAASDTFDTGDYTFYGRYDGFTAVDDRQPLATTFLARYINPGSPQANNYFNDGTTAIVWRDSKVNQGPFTCPAANTNPAWYGLGQEGIAIFDEQEDVETPPQCHFSPCPPNEQAGFPAETQKIVLDTVAFPITFGAGWLWLDLNQDNAEATGGLDDTAEAQSWVITAYDNASTSNTYEIGERAIQLDNGSEPNHCTPEDTSPITTCTVPTSN